jgi:hypothetical protein
MIPLKKENEIMNFGKHLVIFIFMFLLSSNITSQTQTESLEGIYLVGEAAPIGIKVEKLPNGNYIFSSIGKMPDGKIINSEWQSAYVIENHNSTYFFYWHLGREDANDPTTNYIIVYNLTFDGRKLTGVRFFPYSSEIRYEPVRLYKQ